LGKWLDLAVGALEKHRPPEDRFSWRATPTELQLPKGGVLRRRLQDGVSEFI